jgi:anthranilate phosphoribosyltransferase
MASKIETLTAAAEHRESEIFNHQINIDNFSLAIAEIEQNHAGKPHMEAYAARMRELLKSSIEEQEKEAVLLKVIRLQLEG